MAQFYADQEWDRICSSDDPSDLYPIYRDLLIERARRRQKTEVKEDIRQWADSEALHDEPSGGPDHGRES